MIGLRPIATVYTPNEDDGDYTVLHQTGLMCRLVTRMDKGTEDASEDRKEQTGRNRLLWGPADTIPNKAQLEIEGARWNVVANSQEAISGPTGTIVYRRCDVVRALPWPT